MSVVLRPGEKPQIAQGVVEAVAAADVDDGAALARQRPQHVRDAEAHEADDLGAALAGVNTLDETLEL